MKRYVILLTIAASLMFCSSGSYKGSRYFGTNIDVYENRKNLWYISVQNEINYTNEKQKTEKHEIVSNVAIYDINKDSISYLFPMNNTEAIIGFWFEIQYDTVCNCIRYNADNAEYSSLPLLRNNSQIPERETVNKLFIQTYHPVNETYTFWFANKSGAELQKIKEFNSASVWHFDVLRKTLRFRSKFVNKTEIENFPY